MTGLKEVYKTLAEVYQNKCYVGLAVEANSDFFINNKGCLRMVYGTIENHFLFNYHISKLCPKKPKENVAIMLRLGMYCIKFMDSLEVFTVTNEICKLAKELGKDGVVGYLNAVLRKYSSIMDTLPDNELDKYSVIYNRPLWLIKRYIKEYGKENAVKIISQKGTEKTHIRPSLLFGKAAFLEYLRKNKIDFTSTEFGALVNDVSALKPLLNGGKCTVQSLSSIKICQPLKADKGLILDACAAPGGKSVYLAERLDGTVYACDTYPHRLSLINNYARRMNCKNIKVVEADATIYNKDWQEKFDYILLDVPCIFQNVPWTFVF